MKPQHEFFIAGAPPSGFRVYPDHLNHLGRILDDTSGFSKQKYGEFLEVEEGNNTIFIYRRANILTKIGRGGRPGSLFCFGFILYNAKLVDADEKCIKFLSGIFNKAVVSTYKILVSTNKIEQYAYTVSDFVHAQQDINYLFEGAEMLFNREFSVEDFAPIQGRKNSSNAVYTLRNEEISQKEKKRDKEKDIPKTERKIDTKSNAVNPDNELDPEILLDRIRYLDKEVKKLYLLVLIIGVTVVIILLAVVILHFLS